MPAQDAWTCPFNHTIDCPQCTGPLQDGFIHLTKEAELLLGVANHFYKPVPGDFLVLAIDSSKLTSKVDNIHTPACNCSMFTSCNELSLVTAAALAASIVGDSTGQPQAVTAVTQIRSSLCGTVRPCVLHDT